MPFLVRYAIRDTEESIIYKDTWTRTVLSDPSNATSAERLTDAETFSRVTTRIVPRLRDSLKNETYLTRESPTEGHAIDALPCTYPPEVSRRRRQASLAISDAEVDFPDFIDSQYPLLGSSGSLPPLDDVGHRQLEFSNDHSTELLQYDIGEEDVEIEGFAADSTPPALDSMWQNIWANNLDGTSRSTTHRDPALQFQFLIGYARNRSLADTFEIGKFTPAGQQRSSGLQYEDAQDYATGFAAGKTTSEVNSGESSKLTQDRTRIMHFPSGDLNLRSLCNDPLLMKTMEICNGLKTTLASKSVNSTSSIEWSPLTEAMAQQFFCPDNLRTFMEQYWTLWHPHWPCIHRPTFRYHTTPSTLLAPLVLIGASLSPQIHDHDNACIWFDVIEEWVFNDPYVLAVATGRDDQYLSEKDEISKIQALQSTYAVCICQYWQGRESAKTRMRRVRFNVLVGIMRDIGASKARHVQVPPFSRERFDWREFVRTESLIRLMTFVFVLDTGLTTWHNAPPRLVLSELEMAPACPELCFQAESAADCVEKLNAWHSCFPYRPGETMYSVIRTFCSPKLSDDAKLRLPYYSLLSLWAIVKAFYVMIVWNYRLNNGGDDAFDVPLADNVAGTIRSSVRSGGQCLGFWRHAAEYWLLAHILLLRKEYVGPKEQCAWNPLSCTNIDLSWIFAPSPFDRHDQNAFPKLLKFLQREQDFESSMNKYSL
ncbi:Fungal specific transcription factor domain-containing protein [Cladophialophora immunda]|nr:Fungal specific transcription factor domain-containing protein [Cladophialophora immunda]